MILGCLVLGIRAHPYEERVRMRDGSCGPGARRTRRQLLVEVHGAGSGSLSLGRIHPNLAFLTVVCTSTCSSSHHRSRAYSQVLLGTVVRSAVKFAVPLSCFNPRRSIIIDSLTNTYAR
jgi:hypothetical protein